MDTQKAPDPYAYCAVVKTRGGKMYPDFVNNPP
jgi:hypothetical protein